MTVDGYRFTDAEKNQEIGVNTYSYFGDVYKISSKTLIWRNICGASSHRKVIDLDGKFIMN